MPWKKYEFASKLTLPFNTSTEPVMLVKELIATILPLSIILVSVKASPVHLGKVLDDSVSDPDTWIVAVVLPS